MTISKFSVALPPMKALLFLIVLLCFALSSHAQTDLMTFNIRYATPADGENQWELRKSDVVDLIKEYDPHFLGIQEAMPAQVEYLQQNLEDYAFIGHGRDGEGTDSEAVPLFYNKSNFELLQHQVFWLSPTPEKPAVGWDAALPRIAVYGAFRNLRSEDTLHIINTHFDHMGTEARERSAIQLQQWIEENLPSNAPVVLMGDLNCEPGSAPITHLDKKLADSFSHKDDPGGTFSGFDTTLATFPRIDYIFTENCTVIATEILRDKRSNGLYPSDHFPVWARIEMDGK